MNRRVVRVRDDNCRLQFDLDKAIAKVIDKRIVELIEVDPDIDYESYLRERVVEALTYHLANWVADGIEAPEVTAYDLSWEGSKTKQVLEAIKAAIKAVENE